MIKLTSLCIPSVAVKLSLTQHHHFNLICAVSGRGDDAITTKRSLRRRFMVSENGRMINIICIIIFFICLICRLLRIQGPEFAGVGSSSGQTFTPGSVSEGWTPEGWQVEGGRSSSWLLQHPQSLQEGDGLFLPGTGAGFLPFPKGGGGTWVCLTQASPLGRGCKKGLRALFEVEQVFSPWHCTGVGVISLWDAAGKTKEQCHIQCFAGRTSYVPYLQ